jgi:catechol 2,3-dioxygenase-like lactoylglutathione lyase family enzyme
MELGNFSVSLAVKDIKASREFYEKLGFTVFTGDASQGWLILRNGNHAIISLFQGMFDKNILTFNPGWDEVKGERGKGVAAVVPLLYVRGFANLGAFSANCGPI